MAFTLAHPAAVIPLRNLPFFGLVPLIVGSVVPDLVGFLPFALQRRLPNSHSPIGTVLIDLPLGYLLLLMLLLLQRAVVQPLWEPHRSLVAHSLHTYFATRRPWLIALPSLLIGSWTHIVWDRFTHFSYWSYRNLPLLYRPLFPHSEHQLPLFHVLQYLTSAAGLCFMAWCYWQVMRRTYTANPWTAAVARKIYLLVGLSLVALLLGILRMQMSSRSYESIYVRLSMVLKTAIVSFSLLYLLTGLIFSRLTRPAHDHRSAP